MIAHNFQSNAPLSIIKQPEWNNRQQNKARKHKAQHSNSCESDSDMVLHADQDSHLSSNDDDGVQHDSPTHKSEASVRKSKVYHL